MALLYSAATTKTVLLLYKIRRYNAVEYLLYKELLNVLTAVDITCGPVGDLAVFWLPRPCSIPDSVKFNLFGTF